jgi:hypothetical protein
MHWTGRVSTATGVSLGSVWRIWAAHRFQPHPAQRFKLSKISTFPAKLVGLHLDPVQTPCSSQGQTLDRSQEAPG